MRKGIKQRLATACNVYCMKESSRKKRVLKVACQLFARYGYHGTRFRDLCKLAQANNAMIAYYFGDKEGLYQAVQAKARERLSKASACAELEIQQLPPKKRLESIVKSLIATLSEDAGCVAQLAARELVEANQAHPSLLTEGLRDYLTFLETAIKGAVGPAIDSTTVRIEALSILWQCVINSLPEGTFSRLFLNFEKGTFGKGKLVERLTRSCLLGLYATATFDRAHATQIDESVAENPHEHLAAKPEKPAVSPGLPRPGGALQLQKRTPIYEH